MNIIHALLFTALIYVGASTANAAPRTCVAPMQPTGCDAPSDCRHSAAPFYFDGKDGLRVCHQAAAGKQCLSFHYENCCQSVCRFAAQDQATSRISRTKYDECLDHCMVPSLFRRYMTQRKN